MWPWNIQYWTAAPITRVDYCGSQFLKKVCVYQQQYEMTYTTSEDDNPYFNRRQNFKYDKDYKAVNVILLRNVVNSTINSTL